MSADDPVIPVEAFHACTCRRPRTWKSPNTAGTAASSRNWRCDGFAERWVAERLDSAIERPWHHRRPWPDEKGVSHAPEQREFRAPRPIPQNSRWARRTVSAAIAIRTWRGSSAPAGTQSFVLMCIDTDAPTDPSTVGRDDMEIPSSNRAPISCTG
jgi:hypothetical protein